MNYLYSDSATPAPKQIDVTPEMLAHGNALRLTTGEHVFVINGRGLRATCRVDRVSKNLFVLHTTDLIESTARPVLTLVMGTLDSRDRMEFAIEKSIELGVGKIILLNSKHAQQRKLSNDRLALKAIAAITQCGALWLPTITRADSVEAVLASLDDNCKIAVGEITGTVPAFEGQNVGAVMVGPEGGFSEQELRVLQNDSRVTFWRIGENRLRAETAAVAMLSATVIVNKNV
ncbi:MAG: 16S rRNA (uracil(1498)-N(3))-methyltransferase [Ignavibacteria bacterium]|nr:16S rRNA (uracil(1498)-N(3))-methyltransferase [Ignavibacteria bacterium]